MADDNEEILFRLNAEGNAPNFIQDLADLIDHADESMQQFGQSGGEAFDKVAESLDVLDSAVVAAVDNVVKLSSVLDESLAPMQELTDGILLLSNQLNRASPDVQTFIDKQYTLVDQSLTLAQALYDTAVAGGAEASAIASLDATITSLTARMQVLFEAQDALNLTLTANAEAADLLATSMGGAGAAINGVLVPLVANIDDYKLLSDALLKGNDAIRAYIDSQVELIGASLRSAQAILAYATATGAAQTAIDLMQKTVDELTARFITLVDAQLILGNAIKPDPFQRQSDAIDILIDALDNLGNSVRSVVDKQVEQVQAARDAAQTLYDNADATVIGIEAYDRLGVKLAELKDQYLSLVEAQKMAKDAGLAAAAIPPPAGGVGGAGGAGGAPGSKPTQNESQGNAFMLLMLAAAAFQVGKAFVDMGIKADASLTTMQAMTNTTNAGMAVMTTGMEDLAVKTGFDLSTMSDAMYKVHSAFSNVSDSLLVMTAAAHLARAGNSDLTQTSDALITVMAAFGDHANKAAQDANIMAVATLYGKQTMGEFSTQIGVIAAVAQAAGMSFAEAAADESILSLHMHNGTQAARDLSAVIRAVSYDTSEVGAKAIKAGIDFNAAKFQTMDWAQKLEYLNTFTNGNAQTMQKMIGGAGELKTAMGNLDISTKQISANAVTLGLNFDGTKYNAMNLADRLQYLLTVSGGNASRFASLVGGTKNLNDAFQGLNLSTSDVSREAQKLGLNFDAARFHGENLVQKLQTLKDMSHGNMAEFTKLVGGVAGANAALMLLSTDGGEKAQSVLKQMQDQTHYLDASFATAMTSISVKSAQLGAAIANMSYQFLQAIKPELTTFLQNLGNVIDFLSHHMEIMMPILAGLAVAIGVLLVAAVVGLVSAMGGFLLAAAPFIAAGMAIGIVATVIAQHWNQLAPLWPWLVGALAGVTVALIAANIGAITLAITGIPALVAGFVIWAATALAAAAATVLAALPFVALGLLVGIVVVGIILAIQHWGQWMDWISGKTELDFLNTEIAATQARIKIVNEAYATAAGQLAALEKHQQDLVNEIAKEKNAKKKAADEAALAVVTAQATNQSNIVHGYDRERALLDAHNADLLKRQKDANGQTVVQGVHMTNEQSANLKQYFGQTDGGWNDFWKNLFNNQQTADEKQQAQQDAANAKQVAANWAALGKMLQDWATWGNNLTAWLHTQSNIWAANMLQSGSDLVNSLATGIRNAAGAVASAVSYVAGLIAGMLHHSKPDFGPLANDDEWMPHFGDLLETGMLNNVSKLQAASHKMALAVGSGVAVPTGGVGSLGGGNQSQLVTVLSQILSTLQQQSHTTNRIGTSAVPAGLSAVTQQFGNINISGVNNPMQLHRQLNMLAGLAQEYADRGAISGLGV